MTTQDGKLTVEPGAVGASLCGRSAALRERSLPPSPHRAADGRCHLRLVAVDGVEHVVLLRTADGALALVRADDFGRVYQIGGCVVRPRIVRVQPSSAEKV